MKVSKSRYEYSLREGNKAEDVFKQLMLSRGKDVIKSSKQEDIFMHIDFWVDGIGVDVKGNRHLECIWLELINVRGNKGWLKGDAEYIVFDVVELNSFCVFKRIDLLHFVLENVSETTNDKRDFMKYYTRSQWGKKDILIKCKFTDIKHLLIQTLDYAFTKTQPN